MKKLVLIFCVLFVAFNFAVAQVWTYDSDFKTGSQYHGVAVAPDGKVWVDAFGPKDILPIAPGDTLKSYPIYVFNADGSPADFSPIRTFTIGPSGPLDTLKYTGRGISKDNNGNMMACSGYLYRFDYTTGLCINKYIYNYPPDPAPFWSLSDAGATSDGYIILTRVSAGQPIIILDPDFAEYGRVADASNCLQRSVEVSPDGNEVYVGAIYAGTNGVRHYHSDNGVDGPYTLVDTLGTVFYNGGENDTTHVMWAQSLDRDNNGLLWVGTYWAEVGAYDFTGWYALDPTQNYAIVDQVGANVKRALLTGESVPADSVLTPRGMSWTADGKTMYTADFDGRAVKKWTNANPKGPGSQPLELCSLVKCNVTSIDYTDNGIALTFKLMQAYPNPFNPTANIPFDLGRPYHVKLVVYDVNGRVVTTLVDQNLTPGHYSYQFNGVNLASGTYYYQIQVDGKAQTKSMLLVK